MNDFETLRHKKDNLIISGIALMVVGVWDIVKFAMAIILNPKMLLDAVKDAGIEPGQEVVGEVVLLIIFIVLLLIDLSIRCFICLSARAEGRGKKKGWFYLIVAVLMALLLLSSLYTSAYSLFNDVEKVLPDSWDSIAASSLLDILSVIAIVDIIISSVTVKKIRKKDNIQNGEAI